MNYVYTNDLVSDWNGDTEDEWYALNFKIKEILSISIQPTCD